MADNSSQPGTSAGSGNVNNIIYGPIGIFNQHNHVSSTHSAQIVIDYCPAPVSTFSGRYDELRTLKKMFTRHKIVALVGMGGLGKTQLSRKYVQFNKADYQYKYWLESETPEKLKNSFKKFAKKLHVEFDNIDDEVVNDVYKEIQAVRTILVFDNVEKPEHVYDYLPSRVDLPSGVTIHVLVTSRWADWTCDDQIQCYKLQPMDISTSLQIFQKKFDETCIQTMQDEWEELAEMLGYLPLALQVATSYIYKRNKHNPDLRTVLADYMKQLEEGADRLLNDPLTEYGKPSIHKSMMLTLEQLENNVLNVQNDDKWIFSVTIINVVAYMDPDRIYKERLLRLVDNHENICKLDEALAILAEYSLVNQGVSWSGAPIYSIHRIIQSSIRHNQKEMGTADTYYIRVLKYAFAEEYFPRDVLKYADERASAVAEYFKNNPSPKILEYLIENKATAAMEAALELSKDQIQIAMKEHDLLYQAVKKRDLHMTQLLCKYGADINQLCRQGGSNPPLHSAVRGGNMEIVKWLLENGARPTQRDWRGHNALHVAIEWANHKMVPIIIKTDRAVVNETDDYGHTPLHVIHYSDNEDDILSIINVLVESGADITAVDKEGNTVLHSAAYGTHAAAVSLILQRNKDLINIVNKFGKTALHYIPYSDTRFDDERILSTIRILVDNGGDLTKMDIRGNTVFHTAARGANAAAVSLILQRNKDLINIVNNHGSTALHVIRYEYTRIDDERILSTIRVLVESGVDLTKVDIDGNTVLHLASRYAHVAAVSLILQLNKDLIDIKNEDGKTALHVLANGCDLKYKYGWGEDRKTLFARGKETARVLIMNGLSLDTRDNKGCTPLNTVEPEFKDILLEVAEECNKQLPVKRQGIE